MNLDQAYKILDYGTIPKTRAEQILIIKTAGYSKLHGRPLTECPEQQLYTVAQRIFKEAESKVQEELKAQLQQIREEEDLFQYHHFLCDRFNILKLQRDDYSISELEEQLMQ